MSSTRRKIVHQNYRICTVLELSNTMMEPFCVSQDHRNWTEHRIFDLELGIEKYSVFANNVTRDFIIPDLTSDAGRKFISYLRSILLDDKCGPDGGLAFLDMDSGEFLPVGWDYGEVEEWELVMSKFMKTGRCLHTFSATDVVVELSREGDTVLLQILSWEAGIEKSRKRSDIHVFGDADKFVLDMAQVLDWNQGLLRFVDEMGGAEIKTRILQMIRVSSR